MGKVLAYFPENRAPKLPAKENSLVDFHGIIFSLGIFKEISPYSAILELKLCLARSKAENRCPGDTEHGVRA